MALTRIKTDQITDGAITGDDINTSVDLSGKSFDNFTSTGIDDNAAATAITIDSSNNVGIGTAFPTAKLEVSGLSIFGPRTLESGTPSAVAIGIGDSDTGFFRPAYNNIGFSTAGSEAMRIDFAGRVGIGTTSPSALLEVSDVSTTVFRIESQVSTGSGYIQFSDPDNDNNGEIRYQHNDDAMLFRTNDSERLRITSSGNVGIGTTSPSAPLDVVADDGARAIRLRGRSADNIADLNFRPNDNSTSYGSLSSRGNGDFRWQLNTASGSAQIWTNTTERMRIDSSGRVGIGTSSPVSLLNLSTSSAYSVANSGIAISGIHVRAGVSGDGLFGGAISFSNGGLGSSAIASVQNGTDPDRVGLAFFVHSSATGAVNAVESMRIDSSGNVGIGTSSPAIQLHLSAPNPVIRLQSTNEGTTASPYIQFFNSTTQKSAIGYLSGSNNDFDMYITEDANIDFWTNASNRMRISNTGNVGIGTTSPGNNLTVLGTTANDSGIILSTTANDGNDGPLIAFNRGSNVSTKDGIIGNIRGGRQSSGGFLAFSTRDTGGVVTAEHMRIDADGRVGIGTSSPDEDLHISSATNPILKLESSSDSKGMRLIGGRDTFDADRLFFDHSTFRILTGVTEIYRISSNNHQFYTNGTERVRIDPTGNVGIGTSSPEEKLSVNGTILTKTVQYGNNQDDVYLIAGTQSYTGANTNWGTSGFQHRFKANSEGTPRITVDVAGVEKFCILSNGNVGIGTDSPDAKLEVNGVSILGPRTNGSGTASAVTIGVGDNDTGFFRPSFNALGISTGGSEAMRIDSSGDVIINTTAKKSTAKVNLRFFAASGNKGFESVAQGNVVSTHFEFWNNDVNNVGSITTNNSSTSYNTSSDYRLKENLVPISDALTRVAAIPVYRFNFKADPEKTVDGFVAHELAPHIPEAVTGEKDGVDKNGNPEYQGVDSSKVVPLLTAALQEALERIEALEAIINNK